MQASPQTSAAICFSILRYGSFRLGLRVRYLFLETRPAKHRPALGWLEGNRRLCAALRARSPRLGPHALTSPRTFRLALFAMLGIVLELFVVEENLLACCEHKFCAAVDTLKDSIVEFHGRLP
jgi:hypothetical protein